jgi:uncharacterized protein (DUF2147 family)
MKLVQITLLFFGATVITSAQDIFGKWKTIDDETGEEKSIVQIYESNGEVYGEIVELLRENRKNAVCDKCEGKNKNKPILGMTIIRGLSKDEDVYEGGTILDPGSGKEYKCRLRLDENPDTLQVRGYVAFFYKTQYWKRVE